MIEDCKKAAPILLVWLTTSTIIYLQLYWSEFSINPFDYISITEVINYTGSYLMAAAALAVLIGILEFIFPSCLTDKSFKNDTFAIRALLALTLITGAVSLFLPKYWPDTTFIFYAVTPVIARWGARTKAAKEIVNNQALRLSFLIAVVVTPYYAISTAGENSSKIKNDQAKTVKLSGIEKFNGNNVIVVGRLGDYTFIKQQGFPMIHAVLSQEIKSIEFADSTVGG
jgi:hypothetical protein